MNYIEHICEPEKLLLCWQAPSEFGSARYVVAELRRGGDKYTFKYLVNTQDFEEAARAGFTEYPAFRVDRPAPESGVLEAFVGRIPPRSRNDFKEYLQNFRIPQTASISDFALLGYSGAKLPSDGFSIINPFENTRLPCEYLIELAGTRYIKGIDLNSLSIGDPVEFIKEPENEYDKLAIFAISTGQKLGYISRWQTKVFHQWMDNKRIDLYATVERLNGVKERPVIYLFLRLAEKAV